jgi:two-component system chemotaxis response regulator CheB
MANRDIVVIGASTGGVELLLDLVGELPATLTASLFVVLHTSPGYLSEFPQLLSKRGPLPATYPHSTARPSRRATFTWRPPTTTSSCGTGS